MNDVQRYKRVDRAQLRVLFQCPFFAPGVCKLPVAFDDSKGPTACTDGQTIYWHREFFDKLKDQELVTVLAHEVSHCLLGHVWRAPAGADQDTWNESVDHATNLMLEDFGKQVTGKNMANPFPFPEGLKVCKNPAFAGMAEEVIYSALSNCPKSPKGAGPGKPGSKSVLRQAQSSAGRPGAFGEVIPVPAGLGSAAAKKQTEWQATLIQSCEAAKMRGELPGSLERFVKDLLNPKVPWWEVLRALLRETVHDDWSWIKPNQYMADSEFILPSLESERMQSVVMGIDSSGSISPEILRQFKSEEQWVLDDLRPAKLVELVCDTRITQEKEYRLGDTIDGKAPGGGGTKLEKIFERIEERGDVPKAVVILTDLETSFPKEVPSYPVIWVSWGKDEAPFGEVIKV